MIDNLTGAYPRGGSLGVKPLPIFFLEKTSVGQGKSIDDLKNPLQ